MAAEYDPLSKKYRILGCWHVKTFTQIFCWVSLIGSLLMAASSIYYNGFTEVFLRHIFRAVINGCALYGIAYLNPKLLLGPLILLGFDIILIISRFIYVFGSPSDVVIAGNNNMFGHFSIYQSFAIDMFYAVFFFFVIFRCFQYVRERKADQFHF